MARVQRGSGFVEYQQARGLEHGARDRDPLLLAAGELEAALADERLVALRQAHDEVVDVGQPCRALDVRRRGVRASVRDVVVDAVVEQHRVLRHHADRGAQRRLAHAAYVWPVDPDGASAHVVEAIEQAREGGLSRARGADQRHARAGGYPQAQALEDGAPSVVAEGYVLEAHLSPSRRRGGACGMSPMSASTRRSSNIFSMSMSPCFISR